VFLCAASLQAQTLKGSASSVARMYDAAVENDLTFLETRSEVSRFVDAGLLVPLQGNADYMLAGVSYPYARSAVRTFVERLGSQYHATCGEKLVVTSLVRPISAQPRNASDESVHPAGIAVDLRVSTKAACRTWLEKLLLSLERTGVLEVTRERRPPHYHVAVFPDEYTEYVAKLTGKGGVSDDPGAK
jgi:hypothetical protein